MSRSARWWAPTAAHIGPDAVDLAMLDVTGEDLRLDLGGALLAAHRVGEAACRAAAESGLVSAESLADRLAAARLVLGDPLVDAVSKCVSEESPYAALLVRDVLDDADDAALDLFQSAVARGVPQPVAAARAGAVYGVSKQAFGKYRILAIDPKANPLAVTAAADQALLSFVEQLAEEETSESVSKATTAMAPVKRAPVTTRIAVDDEGRPFYNVRDAHGRWSMAGGLPADRASISKPGLLADLRTKMGIGAQAAPTVAQGRPSETAPATAGPEIRSVADLDRHRQELQAKQAQQVAMRNAARAKAKPKKKAVVETEPTTAVGKPERVKRPKTKIKRPRPPRNVISPHRAEAESKNVPDPHDQELAANHPWQKRFDDAGYAKYSQVTDTQLAFVLHEEEAAYVNKTAASAPGQIVRIGHLIDRYGDPGVAGTLEVTEGEFGDYTRVVQQKANQIDVLDEELPEVGVISIEEARSKGLDHEALNAEWALNHGDRSQYYTTTVETTDHMSMASFTEKSSNLPVIWEFILEDPLAEVMGRGAMRSYTVDNNQAFRLPEPGDEFNVHTYYDQANKVLRKRVYLTPVTEDELQRYRRGIHPTQQNVKAMGRPWPSPGKSVEKAATEFEERQHTRDPYSGRWVLMPADAPARTGKPVSSVALLERPKAKVIVDRVPKSWITEHKPGFTAPITADDRTELDRRRQLQQMQGRQAAQARSAARRKKKPQPIQVEAGALVPVQAPVSRFKLRRDARRQALAAVHQKTRKVSASARAAAATRARELDDESYPGDTIGTAGSTLKLKDKVEYRVLSKEDLFDMTYNNVSLVTLGSRVPLLQIRDKAGIEELDAGIKLRSEVPKALREMQLEDAHLIEDDDRIEDYGPINIGTDDGKADLMDYINGSLDEDKYGMAREEMLGFDKELVDLRLYPKSPPTVLVEFDPSARRGGPYDLIHIGDVTYRGHSDLDPGGDDDDLIEGKLHHHKIVVEHWLAVDPYETDAKLRERKAGAENEAG